MPFIPASSSRWETQPDNRRCWPDVWGQRLCRQERGCLHFFRNSFHSPLSWTSDDINIIHLVITSACGARLQVSGMWAAHPALNAVCGVSLLSHALSQTQLGSAAHQQFPWAEENCLRSIFCPWGSTTAWEHPNTFPKVRLSRRLLCEVC